MDIINMHLNTIERHVKLFGRECIFNKSTPKEFTIIAVWNDISTLSTMSEIPSEKVLGAVSSLYVSKKTLSELDKDIFEDDTVYGKISLYSEPNYYKISEIFYDKQLPALLCFLKHVDDLKWK